MDTTEFDRSIDAMQKKMRQISTPSEAAGGRVAYQERLRASGMGGGASESERQRAANLEKQAKLDQEKFVREQVRREEELNKLYNLRFEKIQRINKEINDGLKDRIEGEKEIAKLEDRNLQTRQKIEAKQTFVGQNLPSPPPPSGMAAVSEYFKRTMPNVFGGILGMAGTGLSAIGNIGSSLAANQRIGNVAQGNAIQGLVGEQIANIFSGNNIENILFAKQRGAALTAATKEEKSQRFFDPLKALGVFGAQVGAGMAAGAYAGSVVPGIGTAIGGIGGGLWGAYDIATDPMKRSMLFDRETYNKLSAQREAAAYQQQYQAELMKNPRYVEAAKALQARAPHELAFQRTLGLNENEFRGFSEAGIFTRQQMMEAGAGILGAGGSTRAARQSAFFTNMMQRQYDLTNAPQLIGRLSGAMGGAGESQSALMRMLSESFKIGLDSSEFREENRKFLSISADMIYRAGAGPQGAAAITGMFGGYLADKTGRGLEAAQNAFQAARQMESATTGIGGAIGARAMLKEGFGNLPVSFQAMIEKTPLADLESEAANPFFELVAEKLNLPTDAAGLEEIRKKVRRVKNEKRTVSTGAEQARTKLKETAKIGVYSPTYREKMLKKAGMEFGVETAYTTDLGGGFPEMESFAKGELRPAVGLGGIPEGAGVSPGRMGDKFNEAIAAQDRRASAQITLIADTLKDSLGTSAENVTKFTDALIAATEALRSAKTTEQEKSAKEAIRKANISLQGEEPKAGS